MIDLSPKNTGRFECVIYKGFNRPGNVFCLCVKTTCVWNLCSYAGPWYKVKH
jgi:hypothetical protein